jgi:hypothetical protein
MLVLLCDTCNLEPREVPIFAKHQEERSSVPPGVSSIIYGVKLSGLFLILTCKIQHCRYVSREIFLIRVHFRFSTTTKASTEH